MTIELNDLPSQLAALRDRLRLGEEVVLTDQGETVGRVRPETAPAPERPRRLGFAKGTVAWMAPDFNDPLPDEFWLGGDE